MTADTSEQTNKSRLLAILMGIALVTPFTARADNGAPLAPRDGAIGYVAQDVKTDNVRA